MKGKVNLYIALLFIAVLAVGAVLLIVQVATDDTISDSGTFGGSEKAYSSLRESILEQ